MTNIRIKLREGFLPIVNDNFSIKPGEIITVPEGTPYDPEVLELVKNEPKEEVVETPETVKVEIEPITEEVKNSEEVEDEIEEEIPKTKLVFEDLKNINGIGAFAARKILGIVEYKEDLKDKKRELYDKLNDRYVKALLKTYGVE